MTPVKAGSLDFSGDQSGNLIKVMLYIYIYIYFFFQQQPRMKQTLHIPFVLAAIVWLKLPKIWWKLVNFMINETFLLIVYKYCSQRDWSQIHSI